MEINSISNNLYLNNLQGNKKIKDGKKDNNKVDSFELSDKAKELNNKADSQKLNDIKLKIESKFYDSDEVLNKISQKIYDELNKPGQ